MIPSPSFPQVAAKHMARLVDEIEAYRLEPINDCVPATKDKWVLASNLQKAIRRGLFKHAAETARALLAIDSRYFWRRLLVIAYEDVGLANPELCHDLLKNFRREALHAKVGPEKFAAYFAERLALSLKSRALCDGIAMLEFCPRLPEYERPWFSATDSELVRTICCTDLPDTRRVAALRHICGYRLSPSTYEMATPVRKDLMQEVCCNLGMREIDANLFLAGAQVTESMNVALPLVASLARNSMHEVSLPLMFEGSRGILYAALDRHTRIGKVCLAEFAIEAKPLRMFFLQHAKLKAVAILGVTLFIIEGAALSNGVVFGRSESLRRNFERAFLESVGIDESMSTDLLPLVHEELPKLNRLRQKAINEM